MSFQTASDVLVETLMKQIAHLALARNANVQSEDPATVIRAIVEGVQTAQTTARPTASTMPCYGWKLSDAQIAAVATYVRNAWGNAAPAVSSSQVKSLKKQLAPATR